MAVGRFDYLWLKWRAIVALVLGRRAFAENCFTEMLRMLPADAYALASRAHLLAQRGRHAEAVADLRALVAQHPQRGAADWYNLGFELEQTGEPAEAEVAFRRALDLDAKFDMAWYGLGLALIRQARLDEAAEALQHNTRLQPMSPFGWYQLARVQVDRGESAAARRIIGQLKTFEPRVAEQLERETGIKG